ncbi:hypothetical protein CCACVL1_11280 [Corchorus capsularis]|uniref:Uncharacterized protein n=1 Tax=Corchorus capsularis TaxID=210143 RepID=A0A1R3IM80_COCAP|nr:hypothetical protein CCACVL1_11280 [Corchorus capsularis]
MTTTHITCIIISSIIRSTTRRQSLNSFLSHLRNQSAFAMVIPSGAA